jgi:hypothetical protein
VNRGIAVVPRLEHSPAPADKDFGPRPQTKATAQVYRPPRSGWQHSTHCKATLSGAAEQREATFRSLLRLGGTSGMFRPRPETACRFKATTVIGSCASVHDRGLRAAKLRPSGCDGLGQAPSGARSLPPPLSSGWRPAACCRPPDSVPR